MKKRVVVLGYVVRGPVGGMAWHHVQYPVGFRGMGHDVYFLEVSEGGSCCYDPSRNRMSADASFGLSFAARTFKKLGFGRRWAFYDSDRRAWQGPLRDRAESVLEEADVLVNVSGINTLLPSMTRIPTRIFIDTDPGFTQARNLADRERMDRLEQHTHFFSFGENVGQADCLIPEDGVEWRPTRQPMVLDLWNETPPPSIGPLSTVMQWESYPAMEYRGLHLGQKSDSFGDFMDLPSRSAVSLELALGGANAPRRELQSAGWALADPLVCAGDPWDYQAYIGRSRGEFSVAKEGYVVTRSGWFSERSAAYLASGRPVVLEDTGFTDWMDTGVGVLPFTTPDEALASLTLLEQNYERHVNAARVLCEEYFESSSVLGRLLDAVGADG